MKKHELEADLRKWMELAETGKTLTQEMQAEVKRLQSKAEHSERSLGYTLRSISLLLGYVFPSMESYKALLRSLSSDAVEHVTYHMYSILGELRAANKDEAQLRAVCEATQEVRDANKAAAKAEELREQANKTAQMNTLAIMTAARSFCDYFSSLQRYTDMRSRGGKFIPDLRAAKECYDLGLTVGDAYNVLHSRQQFQLLPY